VFRKHERPSFEDEDTPGARAVGDDNVLRDDGAKGAPADDDDVEVAPSSADGLCAALSDASCSVLQRKRPMLSSVNEVDSEVSNCAMGYLPGYQFNVTA